MDGYASGGDALLDEFARFFEDFHEAYPETSTEDHEAAHVVAMLDAAQLLAENGEPVARPASKAHGPENQASGLPKLRRKTMFGKVFSSRAALVAIGAVVLLIAFSGMAFAGVLPAPIQDSVSHAAEGVNIVLPTSDEGDVSTIAKDESDTGTMTLPNGKEIENHGLAVSEAAKAQHNDEAKNGDQPQTQTQQGEDNSDNQTQTHENDNQTQTHENGNNETSSSQPMIPMPPQGSHQYGRP